MRKPSLFSINIYRAAAIASLTVPIYAASDNTGIIGGIDLTGSAYTALTSSSEEVIPVVLSGTVGGIISSVSMNSSGNSLIGGQGQSGSAYAALISSSGVITPLTISGMTAVHGVIYGAGINSSGNGIIGGRDTSGPPYAALVPPSGNPLVPLILPEPMASGGVINSVSINDSGQALIGGQGYYDAQPAYAALVSPSGAVTSLTLTGGIAAHGTIRSAAINSSGKSIIGGQDLTGATPGYAALVSSSGTVTSLALTGPIATNGDIRSVAINSSGMAIIGGQDGIGFAGYAAHVSSSGTVIPLALTGGVATNGFINSVAINSSGMGIIGGEDLNGSQPGYVAYVSASGTVTPLVLGSDMDNGIIYSVAINDEGNGIIGGWNQSGSQPGYAALVSASGTVTQLALTGGITTSGWINSVALLPSLLRQIPTSSLSGNNLIFANYINEFASEDAFYFIPAILDGTLNEALQSAAPTRNGASIYTATHNLFDLTTSFANHIRNQQSERFIEQKKAIAASENTLPSEELLASRSLQKKVSKKPLPAPHFSIWFETVGALAYQKSQQQTVRFNPTTGGVVLAFDYKVLPQLRVGGGASYLFTHIHEKEGQGHGNINQEEGFIYSSWDNQQFYADLLLMGGGVQIDQVRNIKMTNFSFRSTSHPDGWQLLPHLEMGFKEGIWNQSKTNLFCLNPFLMLDWANAWQESYQEKGEGPFNAAQKSYYGSLLRTEAGLRFYETFFFQSWNFTIQEKVSYVNAQSFNAGKIQAFLVGSPGSFIVETLSSAQNLGVAQLAMSFDPLSAPYPRSTLFYQGEFGTKYQSHQLNIELAWQF